MDDRFEASVGEAYDRGVEAGRADAVPPGVEPMPWCEPHDMPILGEAGAFKNMCYRGWVGSFRPVTCRREDPVAHWVTAKEDV